MKSPADCANMAELRTEIDRLDAELVAMFALRAAYIDRAARIKSGVGMPARITSRVEEVVDNVRRHAETQGLPPDKIEKLWRKLIEWSIEREETYLGKDAS
jgi:isochorismate pyruvate lyase